MISKSITLALTGQLEAYLEEADERVLKAARAAIVRVTAGLEERMRMMVRRAGLDAYENTIKGEIYPMTGLARNPVGRVFVKPSAVHIFEAFETGATIRSKTGGKLTIPIPGSPADRLNFGRDPVRSQQSKLEWFKAKGIELSVVPARGTRPAMIVAESVRLRQRRKSSRTRVSRAKRLKSGGYAKDTASVPLFWLVDETRMPKRLSWGEEQKRVLSTFISEFAKAFAQEFNGLAP